MFPQRLTNLENSSKTFFSFWRKKINKQQRFCNKNSVKLTFLIKNSIQNWFDEKSLNRMVVFPQLKMWKLRRFPQLSQLFNKNFVKASFLQKKTKELIWRILFFRWDLMRVNFSFFHTVLFCSQIKLKKNLWKECTQEHIFT